MPEPRAATRPPIAWMALAAVTIALMGVTLYLIFFVAPTEVQMGVVQKIFYFHVPSAWAMYIGFIAAGLGSAVYLVKHRPAWDALAVAGAEVGVLFCIVVLTTGPLWARKAWGMWWTWDPRLTTTLLAGMIFVAYLALRGFGTAGEAEKRFAAGLAVVGILDLPVIHWSVKKWQGQHPTVITNEGGGLSPDMALTFGVSSLTFVALGVLLLWTRLRIERARQRVEGLELEAAERGLAEEGA